MIQPQALSLDSSGGPYFSVDSFTFKPGAIQRHFILVPESATWAVLKMSSAEKSGRFAIHCVQLIPRMSCKTCEFQKMVPVTPTSENVLPFQVKVFMKFYPITQRAFSHIIRSRIRYYI